MKCYKMCDWLLLINTVLTNTHCIHTFYCFTRIMFCPGNVLSEKAAILHHSWHQAYDRLPHLTGPIRKRLTFLWRYRPNDAIFWIMRKKLKPRADLFLVVQKGGFLCWENNVEQTKTWYIADGRCICCVYVKIIKGPRSVMSNFALE